MHVVLIPHIQLDFILDKGKRVNTKEKTIGHIVGEGGQFRGVFGKHAFSIGESAINVSLIFEKGKTLPAEVETVCKTVGGKDLLFGGPFIDRVQLAQVNALPQEHLLIGPGVPGPIVALTLQSGKLCNATSLFGIPKYGVIENGAIFGGVEVVEHTICEQIVAVVLGFIPGKINPAQISIILI